MENAENIVKNKSLFKCPCGCKVSENSSRKHLRSQKHLDLMEKQNESKTKYEEERNKPARWAPAPSPIQRSKEEIKNYWSGASKTAIKLPDWYDN